MCVKTSVNNTFNWIYSGPDSRLYTLHSHLNFTGHTHTHIRAHILYHFSSLLEDSSKDIFLQNNVISSFLCTALRSPWSKQVVPSPRTASEKGCRPLFKSLIFPNIIVRPNAGGQNSCHRHTKATRRIWCSFSTAICFRQSFSCTALSFDGQF